MRIKNQLLWLFTILIVPAAIMMMFWLNGFLGFQPLEYPAICWVLGAAAAVAILVVVTARRS